MRRSLPSGKGSPADNKEKVKLKSSMDSCIKKVKLRLLEADLETSEWLEVDYLGDNAVYIGHGCSRALHLTGGDRRVQGNRV